jgi:hypothetical protein
MKSFMDSWLLHLLHQFPFLSLMAPAVQMNSTLERLKAEQELLSGTLKYLSAQAALQGAFKSGGGGRIDEPTGGPD